MDNLLERYWLTEFGAPMWSFSAIQRFEAATRRQGLAVFC
jgi:hypothetical protein